MAIFIYCSICGLTKNDHDKLKLDHKITYRGDDNLSGECRKLIMVYEFERAGAYKDDTSDTYKLEQVGRYVERIRKILDEMGRP